VLALLFAVASYYGVEKPFLGLRERRKEWNAPDQAGIGRKPVAKQAAEDAAGRVA
jgi:peptidoglycan/LPS O-acetylase OafA/YrhL